MNQSYTKTNAWCLSLKHDLDIAADFTSRDNGRGNILGSVRLCNLCVCLCVCTATHIMGHHISDQFEGQSHRSNVRVTSQKCKNSSFQSSLIKGGERWRSRSNVKVVSQGQRSQGSRSQVKVKFVGELSTHRLARGELDLCQKGVRCLHQQDFWC